MIKIHKWFCRRVCGHTHAVASTQARNSQEVQEVRDASHGLANSAARIQGMVAQIKREAETIENFSRALRR